MKKEHPEIAEYSGDKSVKDEKIKMPKLKSQKVPKQKSPKPPKIVKPVKEKPPKKPQSPFALYLESELKNMPEGIDKAVFREQCKTRFKQMSDKNKVVWISLAEQDLARFKVRPNFVST